ncbi:MAG: endonuclease domain-containing protein [Chitinophagales bacterium]
MPSPIQTARQLRQKMTGVERVLWDRLRNREFRKWKFRRQHPIVYDIIEGRKRFYVADFYCASKKLIIELDGKHHEFSEQKLYDQARDRILNKMGMKILRIQNCDFFPLDITLEKIETALTSPRPSP